MTDKVKSDDSAALPSPQQDQAVLNTDRDLWREPPGDYYANRIFVNEAGGIGIDVGGHCIVLPIKKWFELAAPSPQVFTPEEVDCLNEYQLAGVMHPFTCRCGCDLVATVRGWICCKCDYTQDWAHGFMKTWKKQNRTGGKAKGETL